MRTQFLVAASYITCSWAFSNSAPLVGWCSHSNNILKSISTASLQNPWLSQLSDHAELCNFDAVVMLEQPGLHASDLRTLPESSRLVQRLRNSTDIIQIPYIRPFSTSSISELTTSISDRCKGRLQRLTLGEEPLDIDSRTKHMLHVNVPSIEEDGVERKHRISTIESVLMEMVDEIERTLSRSIFIYTGTPVVSYKRQLLEEDELLDSQTSNSFAAPSSSGILQRYQILTPALIMALLLVLFLIIPLILIAVNALTSIQTPTRMESPQSTSRDKKNQ